MLSESTKGLVKATIPLLKKYGEEIASRMYELLFEKYPQLKPLFTSFSPNQPKIVAKSIIAYCDNLDDLSILSSTLDKIAQKHVNARVIPEYYPMVGQSLLQAMREVLGESVTDEVITAWREAYSFLANQLIEREKVLAAQKSL